MAHRHSFLLLLLLVFQIITGPSLEEMSAADLRALSSIRNSLTDIPGSDFFSTWDFTAPDPCSSFSGITCSLDRVTTLSLGTGRFGSPGLAGSLSPSISNLTHLTQLILFPALVSGPIPPQLSQLAHLQVLSLTHNLFTGPIPASLSTLSNLHTLDLSHNRLTGSVPPGLARLPGLKVLVLASNQFSGELPPVSTQLLHLDLSRNKLNGRLKSLPLSLRYLSLSSNVLWGPLNGLESLSELVYLDLSMNQFSGPIPFSLFRPTLTTMLLQRNYLSGGLPDKGPPSDSSYGQGSTVDLSHNFLTGHLTAVLAGVEILFLNNNRLMGTVPEEYVKSLCLGTTKTLYLQHNYLSDFPMDLGMAVPDTASLCLSYNCMVAPPLGLAACPASAGALISRPSSQCLAFNNRSSTH